MFTQEVQAVNQASTADYHAAQLALGKSYLANDKFDLAIIAFSRALTIAEEYPTFLLRAEAHKKLQQFSEALINYECVLAIKKNHSEALTQAAMLCTKLNNPAKAKDYFDQALAIRKKFREEFILLTQDYRQALANNLAHKNILTQERKVILASELPDQLATLIYQGNEFLRDNFSDLAIERYNEAIKLCDFDFIALTARGQAYTQKKAADLAHKDFAAALALSDFYLAYWQRGVLFYSEKQDQLAKADFENYVINATSLNFRNMNEARREFVLSVINDADARAAKGRVEDFDSLTPQQFETQVFAAIEQKKYQHALDLLTLAIKVCPTDGIAYAKKAQVYEADGNHSKALLNYSLAIWVSDTKYYESFFAKRMQLNFTLGRYTEAFLDLKNLKKYSSMPAHVLETVFAEQSYQFALEEVRRGNYEISTILYSYAIYLNETNADYYFDRAIAFSFMRLFDDAEQDFATACEIDPKHQRKLTVKKQIKGNQRLADEEKFRAQKLAKQLEIVKSPSKPVIAQASAVIKKPASALPTSKPPSKITVLDKTPLAKKSAMVTVINETPAAIQPPVVPPLVNVSIRLEEDPQNEDTLVVDIQGIVKPTKGLTDYQKLRERDRLARLEKFKAQRQRKQTSRSDNKEKLKPSSVSKESVVSRPELYIELPPSPREDSPEPEKTPPQPVIPPKIDQAPTLFQFRGKTNPLIKLIFKEGVSCINYRIGLLPAELNCLMTLNAVGQATSVGGSILDRVLKMPLDQIENFNIVTNVAPEKIKELFEKFPGYFHDPYLPALFKVCVFRANKIKHTIEIFYSPTFFTDRKMAAAQTGFTCDTLSLKETKFFVDMETVAIYDPLNTALHDILTKELKTPQQAITCLLNNPVNILRAMYKATRYNFAIPLELISAIHATKDLLSGIKPQIINSLLRRKLFSRGQAAENFKKLCQYDLLAPLFANVKFSLLQEMDWVIAELTELDQQYNSHRSSIYDVLPQIYAMFVATALHLLKWEVADAKMNLIDTCPCLAASLGHRADLPQLLMSALAQLTSFKQVGQQKEIPQDTTRCKI